MQLSISHRRTTIMLLDALQFPSHVARGLQRRRAALVSVVLATAFAGNAWADDYLKPIGGPGGGRFDAHCPGDELLIGFELRAADDVDAIRPLCVTALGPAEVSAVSETVWHGGTGGGLTRLVCPSDKPIVAGMSVGAEGVDTVIVNGIGLKCGLAVDTQAMHGPDFGWIHFDGPRITASRADFYFFVLTGNEASGTGGYQHCDARQVAVGVHGRSGRWLDAIGLICGEPRVAGHGRVPPPTPRKKTIAEQLMTTTASPSMAAPAMSAGITATSTQLQPRSAGSGIASADQIGTPALPPPPPVVVEPDPVPVVFSPPLLEDDAQLWACADAAAAEVDPEACSGEESAQAYCQLRNALSGPDLLIADAQPGVPVRAVNGDTCVADACRIVGELQCDH